MSEARDMLVERDGTGPRDGEYTTVYEPTNPPPHFSHHLLNSAPACMLATLTVVSRLVIAPMVGIALLRAMTPDMSSFQLEFVPRLLLAMFSSFIILLLFRASARALPPSALRSLWLMVNFTNALMAVWTVQMLERWDRGWS